MTRGTQSLSFQEYQDRLSEIETSLNVNGDTGKLSFSLETKDTRLGAALDLLKDVLREPALDGGELDVLRNEGLSALESSLSEPQALAVNAMQRIMSPYPKDDVRYQKTIAESIAALKALEVENVKAFYKQFVDGKNAEVAVVGQFDPALVEKKLKAIFEGWRTEEAYQRIETPAPPVNPQQVVINTPDKQNALFVGVLPIATDDTDENYEAMLIGNYILGGGPLSSRLADRVRKKEGLSYSVGSGFRAGSHDKNGAFTIFAISNPENSQKVVSTVGEEIDRILESGVEEEEVVKACESYLQTRIGSRANDRSLARRLRKNLELGRTMEFYAAGDARIESLTKQQVDAALKTFIVRDRMAIIRAGDFEKSNVPEASQVDPLIDQESGTAESESESE